MFNPKLVGMIAGAALVTAATAAGARDLAFSVFVPAASPTVQRIYQPWVDWFNAEAAADDNATAHGAVSGDTMTEGDHAASPGRGQPVPGEGGEHHAAFAGAPGEGALYFGPDNHVLDDAHAAPAWVKVSPFVAMVLGLLLAIWFYLVNPALPARLAESQRPLYLFLKNKWYFDELYDVIFVKPAMATGRFLWKRGDGSTIDGFLNGVALGIVPFLTRLAGKAQTGYIFTYAFWMVLGIAALITWMSISGGAH